MKRLMTCLATGAFATILGVASAPTAFAQSERERATFTLTEPLDVGSVTLLPGTYLIKVVLIDSNRDMLRITDADETKVFTTLLTRPHQILENEVIPTSRWVSWATPRQPRALRTWYARDRDSGHDIIYPQKRAMELAALAKEPVYAIPDSAQEAEYRTAPLLLVTPDRQVKPYEPTIAMTPAKPAPVLVAEARPSPLPNTASRVPLYAALGLLSLAGAFGLRFLTSRAS